MTILKDELKVRPDEGAVEYAERTEAVLEQHYEETGERIHSMAMLPDEGPGETLERIKMLREADNIREAGRTRRSESRDKQADRTNQKKEKDVSSAAEKSSRSFRLKSQERDVERAASAFEEAQKKLYRTDGSKVYGDEEHAERLGKLREGLTEKIGKVVSEAEADAKSYEKEALAFSYTDPASQVPASERGKLETSRAFVKEDCEDLAVPALTERISAVSAGSDRAAKILHARYGRRRLDAINAESNRLASEGQPAGPEAAQEARSLAEAVATLEEQLKDPKTEDRRQAVEEAAKASRQLVRDASRRRGELDGTAEQARQGQAGMAHAAF